MKFGINQKPFEEKLSEAESVRRDFFSSVELSKSAERNAEISILKSKIKSNSEKLIKIRSMINGMKENGRETAELEKKLSSCEDELAEKMAQLKALELGEIEIKEGEVVVAERISEKENNDFTEEKLEEYELFLKKTKEDFLRLKMLLDQEKSEWESDYNSSQLESQVRKLKREIEEALGGGLFSIFTRESRRKESQKSFEGLKALDENFRVSSSEIYTKWFEFQNKALAKDLSETSGNESLIALSELVVPDEEKEAEIGRRIVLIAGEAWNLIKKIEESQNQYDLKYDGAKIMTKKEMEDYESRIRSL